MKTKEHLLALFEKNKGTYFSGEEIAAALSVSRAAVWKAVQSLRREGYEIDAVPNKGYSLSSQTDILSAQGIRKYLEPACAGVKLTVLQTAGSTNAIARERAAAGAKEGDTVIAACQTNGKGRFGRSFFSPAETGIYMSLILRPAHGSSQRAVKLTTMAAVAGCEAIEAATGEKAQIKWVNDLYLNGRKVGGILTEASLGLENDFLDYVVLGIGINVYPPGNGFPEELRQIAGAVLPKARSDGKNHLAAEFLNRFMFYYSDPENADYAGEYRRRSLAVGKEIQVHSHGGSRRATALDVDAECRLIVKYEDGKTDCLSSGEISIRLTETGESV